MGARLGSPDEAVYESPQRALLQTVTRVQPPGDGTHVRLDEEFGVKTMQRLAIGNLGGRLTVLLWPAELKPQALRLYTERRGEALIDEARRLDWTARATPHVAFHTAPASRRLYLDTEVGVDEYVRRWPGGELRPGLRLARQWDRDTAARLPPHELASEIRSDANSLLASVDEPRIPV